MNGIIGFEMKDLPFAATFDALAFIVNEIRLAHKHWPQYQNLVPMLAFCLQESFGYPGTVDYEHISIPHYNIDWHKPEDVTDAVEVDVLGTKLFVNGSTLDELKGKQLVPCDLTRRRRTEAKSDRTVLIAIKADS